MRAISRVASCATALLPLTLAVAGCGSSSPTASSSPAASSSAPATATTGSALTITDAWCKSASSMPSGMDGMTGCFGVLHNAATTPIHLTGGHSAAAAMVQLHETVMQSDAMTMREAQAGFDVPAGGTFELTPGGNHVMLMDLTDQLMVGDELVVQLMADSGEVPVTFSVRDFSGAKESYSPGASVSPSPSAS